jgi:hypothetical protein
MSRDIGDIRNDPWLMSTARVVVLEVTSGHLTVTAAARTAVSTSTSLANDLTGTLSHTRSPTHTAATPEHTDKHRAWALPNCRRCRRTQTARRGAAAGDTMTAGAGAGTGQTDVKRWRSGHGTISG